MNIVHARVVTIHNDQPRRDVAGAYVDAHGGNIVAHQGTYFLYGEAYGNQTLATPYPWTAWPRLAVYTSPDLVNWTYRGPVLTRSAAPGTTWIPRVFYHAPTARFILWFGQGGWTTATSTDGIHFELARMHTSSRFGPPAGRDYGTDGTGVFVDDDGTGYVIFATNPPGFRPNPGHLVSIERLAPDLLSSSKVNVSGFFGAPDFYVESPALFKRKGIYYVTYGSCCCGCNEGGGIVVFTSRSIHGPWVRQAPHADVNCRNASAPVCGGYGWRSNNDDELVFHAQWWGPSFIPVVADDGGGANGGGGGTETAIVFVGRRWLSGPNVPEGCNDICGNAGHPEKCLDGGGKYALRSDLSVWYPLEFDDANGGAILPLRPLPSFELNLPD